MSGKRNWRPVRNASAKADNGISARCYVSADRNRNTYDVAPRPSVVSGGPSIVHPPLCVRGRARAPKFVVPGLFSGTVRAHPIQRFF